MATIAFGRAATTALGATALLALAASGAWLVGFDPTTLVTFLAYALVGTYLVIRRPRNGVGWLLIAAGWALVASTSNLTATDEDRLISGTADLAVEIRAAAGPMLGGLIFLSYAALAFVFPAGGLPTGRGGRVIACLLLSAAMLSVGPGFLVATIPYSLDGGLTEVQLRNPFVVLPLLEEGVGIGPIVAVVVTLVPILVLAVAVVHTVRRYRRSTGVVRLQLRWLLAAVAFVVLAVLFGLTMVVTLGSEIGLVAWLPAILAYPTVPVAIGMAVMRYRLFEIDRIVSRTIAWLIVTAILAAVFVGGIVSLSSLLAPLIGGNSLAVAGSTLLAAILFQPIRRRIQRAVDQRFDRARIDGERIAASFAERMRDEVDLGQLIGALTVTVDGAIRPVDTAVWLRSTARNDPAQPT
jgi:hypothetical protein